MKMLKSFAPFIVFAGVSAFAGWRIAAPAGLVALVAVVALSRPFRVGVLHAAMGAFFAVLSVLAVVAPDLDQTVMHAAMPAWLCLVALVTVAMGHPFTEDTARDYVSAQVAASPRFVAYNRSVSLKWAFVFGALAVVAVGTATFHRPVLGMLATSVLLVYGIKASKPPAEAQQHMTPTHA